MIQFFFKIRSILYPTFLCGILFIGYFFVFDPNVVEAAPPYPQSTFITGVSISSVLDSKAEESDNWPITWAADGNMYTAYGDGYGFDPRLPNKVSMGWARIEGSPTVTNPGGWNGINLRSASEQYGGGGGGKKMSGLVASGDILFGWVRNANLAGEGCELWWNNISSLNISDEDNPATTWKIPGVSFPQLGYCAFLNFGQDYSGARDGYFYTYAADTPSAYDATNNMVLMRVPVGQVFNKSAYQYYNGSGGVESWTSDFGSRTSVFSFPDGVNRMDVTYNAGIGRYMLTMRARDSQNHFSIYEAPTPWGPWSTVFYVDNAGSGNGGWGEVQHIPSKWIAPDGLSFWLICVCGDKFAIRHVALSIDPSITPPPPPRPSGGASPSPGPSIPPVSVSPGPPSVPPGPATPLPTLGPLIDGRYDVNPPDITCAGAEYVCRGPDSLKYPIACEQIAKVYEGEYQDAVDVFGNPYQDFICHGPDYPCEDCAFGTIFPYPQRPEGGHGLSCPAPIVRGQRDALGTGVYTAYDYDRPSIGSSPLVEVPPFQILGGGAPPAYGAVPGGYTPPPSGLPTLPASNIPCGWPVTPRSVTGICYNDSSGDPRWPQECSALGFVDPYCATSVDTTYAHGASYNGIDVGVAAYAGPRDPATGTAKGPPVISTMDGQARRCVLTLNNDRTKGYGIYVVVDGSTVGSQYSTLYAHLYPEAGDVAPPACVPNSSCGGGCLVSTFDVSRGDFVGYTDNTGNSTGPHLHYEVRFNGVPICPATLMDYTNPSC